MRLRFRIGLAVVLFVGLLIGASTVTVRLLPGSWKEFNRFLAKSLFRFTDQDLLNDDLNTASLKGDLKAVKTLLAQGAAVDGRSIHYLTPLMSAAGGGHTKIVRFLLDKGADVNAHSPTCSALICAALDGHADTVQLLLNRGADVQWKNDIGATALSCAKELHHSEVVKILKHAGAKE